MGMERLGKKFIITDENVHKVIASMGEWICKMADGHGVILGLSGGIDSAVVARLVQEAGVDLKVLMLPDWSVASQSNVDTLNDARIFMDKFAIKGEVRDIGDICKPIRRTLESSGMDVADKNYQLSLINIPPRARAMVLYGIGQVEGRRVIGTDNLAEQITGYFTKFGDGAYDFNPLMYCTKGEVYTLARALGVTDEIINKPPSAGLFDGQTDEDELGITYADLDKWIIDGLCGNPEIDAKIKARFEATAHKRCMPYAYTGE